MNLFIKQTHRLWKQTYGYKGETWRAWINVEFEINTYILLYIKDKQGPTVKHGELYWILCSNLYGKKNLKNSEYT